MLGDESAGASARRATKRLAGAIATERDAALVRRTKPSAQKAEGDGNEACGCDVASIRDTCSCFRIDAKRGDHYLQDDFSGTCLYLELRVESYPED